jgi:hypothetical protein
LVASPKLTLDLWELWRLSTEAQRARNDGAINRAIELFEAATSRWRRAPLTDRDRIPGFDADTDATRDPALSLLAQGQPPLTQGSATEALTCSGRPWPSIGTSSRMSIDARPFAPR